MALANNLVRTILLILSAGLSSCAPAAPSGIPSDASVHWSLKSDFTWTWTRNLELGCSSWMAKESWADIELLVEGECIETVEARAPKGRGVSYFTSSDYLIFRGYWPWSVDSYFDQVIADSENDLKVVRPCGHELSPEQLADLRIVGQEALDRAQTPREKRVLARVNERLANIGSGPLSISQEGCIDLPLEGRRPPPVNVWRSE